VPYIKQEDREFYDNVITLFQLKLVTKKGFHDEINMLVNHVRRLGDMAQDGHMNYFITKFLLQSNVLELPYFVFQETEAVLRPVLLEIITEVYSPPKYYRYNRAIGMLECCRLEFERRYSTKAVLAYIMLDKIINLFYKEIIGPYEDEKIEENGDV